MIFASAPLRVCDIGGWTDTWFARYGTVLNLAVSPRAQVRLTVRPRRSDSDPPVVLHAEQYGDSYAFAPGEPLPGRHPLLEAVIDEIGVPAGQSVEIRLSCAAPAGCSTGTSAAVAVALVGALDRLTPGRMRPQEVAMTAHRIEVDRLGLQSGVQDQLCSTFGGIHLIEIPEYPTAVVSPIRVPDAVRSQLERRLVLLFLGRPHVSSAVHDKVIAELQDPDDPRLQALRALAPAAREALVAGDLAGFGAVMAANTDAQAALHPDLVGPDARQAIEVARRSGATGWKVNGAGGEGGSLTLLSGPEGPPALVRRLHEANPLFRVIPTKLSRSGLRVRESPEGASRGI